MARTWGYWTRGKLDILRLYLDAFTTATKHRATDRIYPDSTMVSLVELASPS